MLGCKPLRETIGYCCGCCTSDGGACVGRLVPSKDDIPSGRAVIRRRSHSFSVRKRSFSCFSSPTWFSSSRAESSRAASRCFFLMRKRALAAVFLRRLSSSIARRLASASASGLPVSTSFTRSARLDEFPRRASGLVSSSSSSDLDSAFGVSGSVLETDRFRDGVTLGVEGSEGNLEVDELAPVLCVADEPELADAPELVGGTRNDCEVFESGAEEEAWCCTDEC